MMAALLYFSLPSIEYGSAFLLLGVFFELLGWKAILDRKRK